MAEFTYAALTDKGAKKTGNIVAESKEMALQQLREQGLFPTDVQTASALNREIKFNAGGSISAHALAVFCRQFHSMLDAGVALVPALQMLGKQADNKTLAKAIGDLEQDVRAGLTLGEAMRHQGNTFPEMMIAMVEAGEASGKLDVSLDRMADQFDRVADTQARTRKAAIYPVIVLVVCIAIIVFMLIKVIPSYETMFESMDMTLPPATLMMIALSHFIQNYWFIIIGVIVAFVLIRLFVKSTPKGRLWMDTRALKFPFLGPLRAKTACSVISRTLATLIYSGVSITDGLHIVSKVIDNYAYKVALEEAEEDVKKGVPLSVSLAKHPIFPPMVVYMISVGEETGQTDEMMNKLADYYDDEVKMATETAMAAIEPMIILVMAGLVVILIAAVMGPMIKMYSNLDAL